MINLGFEINWNLSDHRILQHPLYQKWSTKTIVYVVANKSDLQTDMGAVILDNNSAPILSYLSWVAREALLVASLG